MTAWPYILRDHATDIVDCAVLGAADVAVAHEGDVVSVLNVDDAVEDEVAGFYLGQNGITHMQLLPRSQLHAVSEMLQEGAHTVALDKDDGRLALLDIVSHQWQEAVVLELLAHGCLSRRVGIFAPLRQSPGSGKEARNQIDDIFD